ncbi:MAG: nucleotide exchange factor GrpE [Verrucomicrobia bacterium]|nr:nucleotide exchange factor GrpE [Verrucomicrobiota bacterium]
MKATWPNKSETGETWDDHEDGPGAKHLRKDPKVPFVPFIIADVTLLAIAFAVVLQAGKPIGLPEILLVTVCSVAGAMFMTYPFRKQFDLQVQEANAERLNLAVCRLQAVENLATRMESVTSQWNQIEKKAEESMDRTEDISRDMIQEAQSFREFLKNASSEEVQHLKLLVDKLKKAEKDWLQVIMAMMDHCTALKWAATKSGNPNLAQQISNFHFQLCEVVRQVGLTLHESHAGDNFDEELHQVGESNGQQLNLSNAVIRETKSVAMKFRGVIVRKALVLVESGQPAGGKPGGKMEDKKPEIDRTNEPIQSFGAAEVGSRKKLSHSDQVADKKTSPTEQQSFL